MKIIVFLTVLFTINFSLFSQSMSLCDSVSQYNTISGGPDCSVLSDAPFAVDSYQWVNCDSSYAIYPDDTIFMFYANFTGNVALIVTVGACVDTSNCEFHCSLDIDELDSTSKKITRIFDINGNDSEDLPNKLLIHIYDDGTTRKVFRCE